MALLWLAGCQFISQYALPPSAPTEMGLHWQECPSIKGSESAGFNWKEVEPCFGHAMPYWNDEEKANFGTLVSMENLRLTIGNDVYETMLSDRAFFQEKYTLFKNEKNIRSLSGTFTTFSPNRTLQNVGGKAVWEFSDGNTATIISDGADVRELYGIERAYRPYGINGKLIFIGEKDRKYFVVYNGHKVGPSFDKVMFAYCCEPVLWSVNFGQGRYLFWGLKNDKWVAVEISR